MGFRYPQVSEPDLWHAIRWVMSLAVTIGQLRGMICAHRQAAM